MQIFSQSILTIAYLPPIEYFYTIAHSGKALVEQNELYQKQSYRNRCRIYSTQGVEQLIIPVVKEGVHARPIRDIAIDYSENWIQQHRRALEAAYNNSPFYIYYRDDIEKIMESKPKYLFDLDVALTAKLLELVGLKADISFKDEYVHQYSEGDFRSRIQPKYKGESLMDENGVSQEYYQVFSPDLGFKSNLSIVDLLSAEGPNAISYII